MGRLLDKIREQGAADLRICGKQAGARLPESVMIAENCGFQEQNESNPQNPQSLRTLTPAPDIAFRKSANPQGVPGDFQNKPPHSIRRKLHVSAESRLMQLACVEAMRTHSLLVEPAEIAALIPPGDARDAERCTPEELQAWGAALAMRAVRYRGQVPAGWDKVTHCAQCGPVYSFAGGDCLACPWCELRQAGKWFPQSGIETLENQKNA